MINKLRNVWWAIPFFVLSIFMNTIISFTVSGIILIQMLSAGYEKHFSLIVSIFIAIGVHAFILWNHKIYNYIKKGLE